MIFFCTAKTEISHFRNNLVIKQNHFFLSFILILMCILCNRLDIARGDLHYIISSNIIAYYKLCWDAFNLLFINFKRAFVIYLMYDQYHL